MSSYPCPRCYGPMRFIHEYQQWWCDSCRTYVAPAAPTAAPMPPPAPAPAPATPPFASTSPTPVVATAAPAPVVQPTPIVAQPSSSSPSPPNIVIKGDHVASRTRTRVVVTDSVVSRSDIGSGGDGEVDLEGSIITRSNVPASSTPQCPNCKAALDPKWRVCPECATVLRRGG